MNYRITENRKNIKYRSSLKELLILLLCLFIFGFSSKAAFNAFMEKKKSEKSVSLAKLELARLEERHSFISQELDSLSSLSGREIKLREKFGVGRPGEQVAIIVESKNSGEDIGNGNKLWNSIKDFFKSLFKK